MRSGFCYREIEPAVASALPVSKNNSDLIKAKDTAGYLRKYELGNSTSWK